MKCVYGASFKELQVFSCFYQRFETWSIAFTLSKFICYLFLRFNYCYISFHKDGLKMNKSSVHKTKYDFLLAKIASRKKKNEKTTTTTKYRVPAQRKYFLCCKWLLATDFFIPHLASALSC